MSGGWKSRCAPVARKALRIEEVFGWIKSSACLAKIKLRGRARGCRLHSRAWGV